MKKHRIKNYIRTLVAMCFLVLGVWMVCPKPVFAGELANQFTLSVWVRGESSVATKALVAKAEELRLVTDASGNPVCQLKATTWQTAATSSTAIAVGTWAHVTCTYDKVTLRVFVNGVQTGTQALTATVDDTANNFKLGEDDSSGSTYGDFQGVVDDFKVYNYARTTKQIVSDMNAGHPAVGSPVGSPVAHYKFNEGTDNTCTGGVNDVCNYGSGGSALDGAQSGMAVPASATSGWTNSGKLGKAMNFDGSDDHIRITDDISLKPALISISVWVKLDTLLSSQPNGFPMIVSKYLYNDSGYGLFFDKINNRLQWRTYKNLSSRDDLNITGIETKLNTDWHHIIATWDGTVKNIYIDGIKKASVTYSGSLYHLTNPQDLYVGSYPGGANVIAGSIDEVKIYNYALSEDEIKLDYNQGKAIVMGNTGTASDGKTADNSASRAYCPPGNVEGNCAAGQNPAPVAEWKMDEGTGQSVADISGNANAGQLGATTGVDTTDPTWTNGKQGKAINFDGSDDYVDAGNTSSLQLTGSITMSTWVKINTFPTNDSTTWKAILSKSVQYGTAGQLDYSLGQYSSSGVQNLQAVFADNGVASAILAANSSETGISLTGTWYNISATWDGTTNGNGMKIYVNGNLKKQGTSTITSGTDKGRSLRIGNKPAGFGTGFDGVIDQVKIFNYARTPAQIAWDYNQGEPVARYKFDECTGTNVDDWSPDANGGFNTNDATLTIGASGSQTSAGSCSSAVAAEAWNNGTTGKWNASINLDGTDDYAQITDTANLRFDESTKDFALFAWVKRTTTGTEYILSKEDADNDGYRLMFNSSNQLVCSEDATDVTSSSAITDTNWHMVGCTIDRDGNGQVYIDGKADGATVAMGTDAMATTSNIRLGTRSYTSTNYFNGQIDEVNIYNYVLSSAQVKLLYNNSSAVKF